MDARLSVESSVDTEKVNLGLRAKVEGFLNLQQHCEWRLGKADSLFFIIVTDIWDVAWCCHWLQLHVNASHRRTGACFFKLV